MQVARDRTILTGLAIVIAIALIFLSTAINTQAQTNMTVTPNDVFSIPGSHGSIHFAVNGSCTSATLRDNTWVFTNLKLANNPSNGTLKFSTDNSNVTIYYFRTTGQFGRTVSVKYTADIQGKQYVNLGLNTTRKTDPSEWLITVPNGGAVVNGIGWNLLPDNTVEVNGLKGNVTVSHFNYYYPAATGTFYEQHSIAIITVAVAAVILAGAVVIKFRVKR
jgi:hypothetical protein